MISYGMQSIREAIQEAISDDDHSLSDFDKNFIHKELIPAMLHRLWLAREISSRLGGALNER